jgi:hypothetical protein
MYSAADVEGAQIRSCKHEGGGSACFRKLTRETGMNAGAKSPKDQQDDLTRSLTAMSERYYSIRRTEVFVR